jgi:hypothetical protein
MLNLSRFHALTLHFRPPTAEYKIVVDTLKFCGRLCDGQARSGHTSYYNVLKALCVKDPLFHLIQDKRPYVVQLACNLVNQLSRTNEYRDMMLLAGLDGALKDVAR